MSITLLENFRAVFYAPFYAAPALGAYAAEGLDVKIEPSPNAALTMQTVISGAAEVSWGGPLRLMFAREQFPESDPIVFCEVVGRDPFFILGREANPGFRLSDVCGKRFGRVTEVPTPWMCLQHDLRSAGLEPSKITLARDRSMPENCAALRAGEVDLIQVFQPYATELVRSGDAHVWYAAANRGPTAYTSLNTTRAYAEKNPEVLRAMCRAMYRTQKWIAAHDGTALAEVVNGYFPDVPRALLAASFDAYLEIGLWNRTPSMYREGLEWLRDAAMAAGLLHTRFKYEAVAEMRFADEVIREDPPPL
jgi:NitT/TauT family transport system substrate-binding protein